MLLCFSLVHPRRTHGEDLRLLLEPQRAVGHLLCIRGQHHASLANGKSLGEVNQKMWVNKDQ